LKKPNTRPRDYAFRVWVLPRERAEIEAAAAEVHLSASAYLRTLGLTRRPLPPVFDKDAVLHLAQVNGDQGRLGGLLKMWLSTRRGEGAPVADVQKLLADIGHLQARLEAALEQLEARR
jgi:hypothetical protein